MLNSENWGSYYIASQYRAAYVGLYIFFML